MRYRMTRALALFLVIALGCMAVPAAMAVSYSGDFGYEVVQGKAALTEYRGAGGVVSVPASVNGYAVFDVKDSVFMGNTQITKVTLPASLTNLSDRAFYGCTALTEVNVPAGVRTIASYTFSGCTSLDSVSLSEGIAEIGIGAFQNCAALTVITIPSSVTDIKREAFRNSGLTTLMVLSSYLTVDATALPASCTDFYCSAASQFAYTLEEFTDPAAPDWKLAWQDDRLNLMRYVGGSTHPAVPAQVGNVTVGALAPDAFADASLETLRLPADTLEVAANAFDGTAPCVVYVPDGCTDIGSGAFANNDWLYEVYLPGSIQNIAADAFDGCDHVVLIIDEMSNVLYSYVEEHGFSYRFQ